MFYKYLFLLITFLVWHVDYIWSYISRDHLVFCF